MVNWRAGSPRPQRAGVIPRARWRWLVEGRRIYESAAVRRVVAAQSVHHERFVRDLMSRLVDVVVRRRFEPEAGVVGRDAFEHDEWLTAPVAAG